MQNSDNLTKEITSLHKLYEGCDMIYNTEHNIATLNLGNNGTFLLLKCREEGEGFNQVIHYDRTIDMISEAIAHENENRFEFYREKNMDHAMDNMPDPTMEGELN